MLTVVVIVMLLKKMQQAVLKVISKHTCPYVNTFLNVARYQLVTKNGIYSINMKEDQGMSFCCLFVGGTMMDDEPDL